MKAASGSGLTALLTALLLCWSGARAGAAALSPPLRIINLNADHLTPVAPATVADLRAAIRKYPSVYAEAAARIGLTPGEYAEFRRLLQAGSNTLVLLPRHIYAMSGKHHDRVYALRSVIVPAGTLGWRVFLADGTEVYVPRECGNLSLVRSARARPMAIQPVIVPILLNGGTVHAKAGDLNRGGGLAALVTDGRSYVPMRTMFQQMGAAMTVSRDGTTVTAVRSGASVAVTHGKSGVTINGRARRSLDDQAMLFRGTTLVSARVMADAFGADVRWASGHGAVLVQTTQMAALHGATTGRVPSAAIVPRNKPTGSLPPVESSPGPTPTAIPGVTPDQNAAGAVIASNKSGSPNNSTPVEWPYHGFIQGAITTPENFNEFTAGQFCPESYVISGAYTTKDSRFAGKADYRRDTYLTSDNATDSFRNHYTRFATIDGGIAFTPVFLARQSSLDARVEYQVAAPAIYAGIGYLHTSNNYGYPQLNAVGFGIEKLPDFRPGLNAFGSVFYYPSASGNYTVTAAASPNFGRTYQQRYEIVKYDVGAALVVPRFPIYLYGGFSGDRYSVTQNAPVGQVHDGPYAGFGVKL